MKLFLSILFSLIAFVVFAQHDSLNMELKPNPFEVFEMEKEQAQDPEQGKNNFEHWMYSQKKHAFVSYFGSIAQGGFSNSLSTSTWHYDLGALYMGHWVSTKAYKLNAHVWVEHTNLLSGSDPKQFAKDLNMITIPNASEESSAGFSIEYFHVENFFFDGFWDVTVGKLEPTFYISYTPYSAWDKMTLFSKTSSSDPVPDMEGAFGFFTEFNFTDFLSIGAQVLDDNPRNEYFDPGNFFGNTTYNYQAFVRWAIPSKTKRYSYHILNYYTYPQSGDKSAGSGWMYIGNQAVSKSVILTLKLSNGSGRILKYNAAYAAGFIYLNPFKRKGDQTGATLVVNELEGQFEYGIDSYYKLFFKNWISMAASAQAYYTKDESIAFIPGIRVMLTY